MKRDPARNGKRLVCRLRVGRATFRVYEVADVNASLGERPSRSRAREITLGAMDHEQREILIRRGRPVTETTGTLVHELLHAVLPQIEDDAAIVALEDGLTPALMRFGLRWTPHPQANPGNRRKRG